MKKFSIITSSVWIAVLFTCPGCKCNYEHQVSNGTSPAPIESHKIENNSQVASQNDQVLDNILSDLKENRKKLPNEVIVKSCLDLLKDYQEPGERAKIFALLAQKSNTPEKRVEYAYTALNGNLEVMTRLGLYGVLYGGLYEMEDSRNVTSLRAIACFQAIRLIMDNQTQKSYQQLPPGPPIVTCLGEIEQCNKLEEEFDRESKERERDKVEYQNNLVRARYNFLLNLVSIYCDKPYKDTEIYHLSNLILRDPAAVKEVMDFIALSRLNNSDKFPKFKEYQSP